MLAALLPFTRTCPELLSRQDCQRGWVFSAPTMNLQLLNPFAHENFPERVESSIDANAQCVRFNSGSSRFAGSYLAIGRTDGCVAILDLATRAYLRFLEGHVKTVTSLW